MQCAQPQRSRKLQTLAAVAIAASFLVGCGSSDNGVTVLPVGNAKIQGAMRGFDGLPALNSLTGLGAGLSVTLQNNGADDVMLTTNAAFAFRTELEPGATYAVTVKSQPLGQTCTVDNGAGTVDAQGTSVANVAVNCVATSSLGGGIRGLNPGETVSIISGGVITLLGANGAFALPGTSAKGTPYAVTVFGQPANGVCTITNGTGTVVDNVMSLIGIQCASTAPSVKGALSGLATGERIELQNNAGDTIALTSDQNFAFPSNIGAGGAYAVTVSRQPVAQMCSVANGAGTINENGDVVSNIAVSCTVSASVGGKVDGLNGGSTLVLANGGVTLPVAANGAFAFPGLLSPGVGYDLTVATQPAGQFCTVVGGAAVAVDGATSAIGVTCLGVASTSLPFLASVMVGGVPATMTYPLTNNTASTVQTVATASGDFSASADCASIAPGATCGIPVTFNPASAGVSTGTLSISVNGAPVPLSVPLAGTGIASPGMVSIKPNTVQFSGTTVAGQASAEVLLVVSNSGGSSSTIGTPVTSRADFIVSSNSCGPTLAPADTCSIGVRFTPTPESSGYLVGIYGSLTLPFDATSTQVGMGGISVLPVATLNLSVSGLQETFGGYPTNSQFSLVINGMSLTVNSNGTASYQNNIFDPNGAYVVSMGSQPNGAAGQMCTVTNGSGFFTAGVQNTSPTVTCATPAQKKIVGTVSGLVGGSVQLSAQFTSLTVNTNGTFTLTPTPGGYTTYSVTVTGQPAGQSCVVSNGNGNFDLISGLGDTAPSVVCTP